jgi:Zn-dependent protease with chaperone function
VRFIRALWPVIFLVPLSWWANRGCELAGIDPLYHATLWIHERLGWFVGAVAVLSAAVVLTKIVVARLRFARLKDVAEAMPPRVQEAVERASAELEVAVPSVLYVDLAAPIATTVLGRTIVLSRGFIELLDDAELELVVRHELAHVRHGDAAAGVLWHLAFAALLIPGFEPLERRLHAQRERSANVTAATGREEQYLSLVARISSGADVCADADLGLEAAARRPEDRWLVWVAPLAVACLAIALPLSHAAFRHDLPYLLSHHC